MSVADTGRATAESDKRTFDAEFDAAETHSDAGDSEDATPVSVCGSSVLDTACLQ